jgi:hypothetical protein
MWCCCIMWWWCLMVGDVGALGSSDPDTAISEWVGGELK